MQDFGGTKRGIHPPSKACIGQGDLTSAAKKFDPARMLVSKGKGGAAAVVRIEARKAAGACSSRGGPPSPYKLELCGGCGGSTVSGQPNMQACNNYKKECIIYI
jgi:hypothetical protein